ncbi:oxygenase [Kitasatospora sp. MAA4]|uniref:FAD-dependent monooxygenase n=1 Tax=Kitasatospora sp. MAA4 TaxID=3035093 RepID=UPI0024750766|nr:FAD-dependent monooxygenase [Kitasatospora sp. MAA4]MDH6137087.1 oxygenase [Kitasatospora sp. MAA4]
MGADSLDTDVIVVGAGPVGLMLAGELRLGGADVIVLEQRDAPTTESRASTLHARTMEIFDDRGLLAALGTPPNEPLGHFGGIPLDLTLPSSYPGQWKVPQTRTEELLQEWALSLGADIRRGHELTDLSVTEDFVEAETLGPGGVHRVRGRYLVGCDGEDSTVRRLSGASFPGQSARRELIRADVAGVTIPNRRFMRLEHGLAIAARRADGVTRVMVHEFGRAVEPRTGAPEFAEVVEIWKRVTGEDLSGGTPLWVNSFGDANRLLARYREGRVLFAGDAAHQQMPSGGQALNLGLQDAVNLGWKLARQVGPYPSEELLDSYHSERHAVGESVLANIRAQTLLLLGGAEVEPVRELLGELIGSPETRRQLAGMISGLDVRYEVGAGDYPLLGARLPYAELITLEQGSTSTAALLRTGRGVLLDLSGGHHAPLRAAAGAWADRVTAVAALPVGDPLPGTSCVLVRPDGYVVWAGTDEAGAQSALRRWFGPPAP